MNNRDVYEGLRTQIERGHLPLSVIADDLHLRFKNPSIEDFDWAIECSPRYGWKQDIALIARCLVAYNGVSVQHLDHQLIDLFSRFSKSFKRKLFNHLIRFTERAKDSFMYLEAYCYEDESRALWRAWKANRLMGLSPLEGQTRLTPLQVSWITWNTAEDERLTQKDEWDKVLFSASAFNGSVQKIRAKWDSSDQEEEENREKIRQAARTGELETLKDGVNGQRKKSVKDLQEEMRRWVAGEEDMHDRVVREYKETMKRKVYEQQERAQRMREESIRRERELRQHNIVANPVHGLTDSELQKFLAKKDLDKTSILTGEEDEYRYEVLERVVFPDVESGNISLREDGKGLVQKEGQTLMDKIASRKPTM